MRSGELCTQEENNGEGAVELAFHDVAADNLANPTEIQVRLKKSKTDVFRQGTLNVRMMTSAQLRHYSLGWLPEETDLAPCFISHQVNHYHVPPL